jgi:hypothetical protein
MPGAFLAIPCGNLSSNQIKAQRFLNSPIFDTCHLRVNSRQVQLDLMKATRFPRSIQPFLVDSPSNSLQCVVRFWVSVCHVLHRFVESRSCPRILSESELKFQLGNSSLTSAKFNWTEIGVRCPRSVTAFSACVTAVPSVDAIHFKSHQQHY